MAKLIVPVHSEPG